MKNIFEDFNINDENYDGKFNNKFLNLWTKIFKTTISGNQDFLGTVLFYKGLSVMCMKNENFMIGRKDVRLFPIVFSDAGSGKGMFNELYYDIFKPAGMSIKTVRSPTKEKLVGSFNGAIQESNIKKGDKGLPGEERWVDPKIPGYFEDYDDLIFEEALSIFETEKQTQTIMRCVADNYGSPTNWLSSETLKNQMDDGYFSACSWTTFSYHLSNLRKQSEDLIHNGIYQRSLGVFIRMTEQQRMTILEYEPPFNKKQILDLEVKKKVLIKMIKDLFEKYNNVNFCFEEKASKRLVKGVKLVREKMSKNIMDKEKNVLDSYLTRAKNNIKKIACMNALLNERKINEDNEVFVKVDDILIGIEVVKLCLISVFNEIKPVINRSEVNLLISDCRRFLGSSKRMYRTDFVDTMQSYWRIGRIDTVRRLELIDFAFNKTKGKGNGYMYSLK